MKKTVRVTIEKEIEIDIDDSCLTPEALAEFESYMFSLCDEGDTLGDKQDEMFKYVAQSVVNGGRTSVEGLGVAVPDYMKGIHKDAEAEFDLKDETVTLEIV